MKLENNKNDLNHKDNNKMPFLKFTVLTIRKAMHFSKMKKMTLRSASQIDYRINKLDMGSTNVSFLSLPFFLCGIIFISTFIPLTWHACLKTNSTFIDVLALQTLPKGIGEDFFNLHFPLWSSQTIRPLVYSFAVLYGFTALVAGFMVLSGGLTKLVITSNGLLLGYYITKFTTSDLLGWWRIDFTTNNIFRLKISYIFLAYYLKVGLTNILSKDDYSKEKYSFLFSGLYSFFTGWLLAKGFGANKLMLNGMVFIIATFLSIAFFERFFRPIFNFCEFLIGSKKWKKFETEKSFNTKNILIFINQCWHTKKILILVVFFICTIFPFFVAIIYHLVLEGKY